MQHNNLLDPLPLKVRAPRSAPVERGATFVALWMQKELRRALKTDLPFVQIVEMTEHLCDIRIHNLTQQQANVIRDVLAYIHVTPLSTEIDTSA